MALTTLADLIAKVRKLTARPSVNQISDASIVDYINQFYEYDFPQQLKLFDFRTNYSFITQPNVDQYTLSQADRNSYKSFEPPVYCSGYSIAYYQNTEQFHRLWPDLSTYMTLATASGIAGPYTGTLNSLSVLRGSVLVSAVNAAGVTLTARDTTAGTLVGDVLAGATVNYLTGAIAALTFTAVIPNGNAITVRWATFSAAKPISVLFYDNTFTLRPVPDAAYEIKMQAFLRPFAVTTAGLHVEYSVTPPTSDYTTVPFLDDYFQLLAYGAALKIFVDSIEMENYQALRPLYEEQLRFAERKSMMQIKTQRTQTIYSEDNTYPYGRSPTQ